MNKKDEIKIAKNIFAMTYNQLENLYNKYEQPELLEDMMEDFKRFSKFITNETNFKNKKDWWKIWKTDYNPDEIEDELLDAIAHKVFLHILKQVSYIVEVKEKMDDYIGKINPAYLATKTKKEQEEILNTLKDLQKKEKKVQKDKVKVQESLRKLISNINTVMSSTYSNDKKYQGIVKNRNVRKMLDDLKEQITNVEDKLNSDEEYQLSTPRVAAALPAGGYKQSIQDLIEEVQRSLDGHNYRSEDTSSSSSSSPAPSSSSGNIEEKLNEIDNKDHDSDFDTVKVKIETLINTEIERKLDEIKDNINEDEVEDKLHEVYIPVQGPDRGKELNEDVAGIQGIFPFFGDKTKELSKQILNNLLSLLGNRKYIEFYTALDKYITNYKEQFSQKLRIEFEKIGSFPRAENNKGYTILLGDYPVFFRKQLREIKQQFEKKLDDIDTDDYDISRVAKSSKSIDTIKIARKIAGSFDDDDEEEIKIINNPEDFKKAVEWPLYDILEYIGKWQGFDAYQADTNGNDIFYRLIIYVNKDGVYFEDASLTEDDIERDPENMEIELQGYKCRCEKFPFEVDEFVSWINDKIDYGIEKGAKALQNWQKKMKNNLRK